MNLKTLLTKVALFAKDLVVLVVLVALFAASIYGVKTPPQKSVTIGPYNLSVFDSGLAIYAQGRKTPYWGISPLNDYILTKEGKRETLLSGDEFSEKKFETNLEKEKIGELKEAVEYFLGKDKLVYELKKPTMEVSYKTSIEGNLVKIERNLQTQVPSNVVATGITLSFTGSDLVYEPTSNTFIYYTDKSDVTNFAEFVDGDVNLYQGQLNEYLVTVNSGKVALVNKYLPGVLLITTNEEQRLIVDIQYGVILTEQQARESANIKTEINLTVFDNPEDLAKSL